MRVWDIPPSKLCNKHLLGEHRELHAIWTILTTQKKGYSHHPETKRWAGKLKALFNRHELLVKELANRGFSHHSPLDASLATGSIYQDELINSLNEQQEILKNKKCSCFQNT